MTGERIIGQMQDNEGRTVVVSEEDGQVTLHAGGSDWRTFSPAGLAAFIDLLDTAAAAATK